MYKRQVLVREPLHRHAAPAGPAGGGVDQLDDLRPRQHHPPPLRPLADEPQLRRLDPAQRDLLVLGQREPGAVEVDRVAEAAVVQAQPAPAFEPLGPLPARRGLAEPVRGSGGAGVAEDVVEGDRRQVQGPLDGQLRGVQRAPPVRVAQPRPAQVHRHADLRAAQTHLPVRLQQLALEVLRDGHPVRGDGPALVVPLHHGLADQQVGADLRVGQPDPAGHPAARQVQIALGVQPGGVQPGYRAVDQAQGDAPGLGQLDLAVEAAGLEFDVGLHEAAGQVEPPGDPYAAQLQRGHPARHRRRPVEQQQRHHLGSDAAPGVPGPVAVRIVLVGGAGAEIAHAARPERLPHTAFGTGEIRGFLARPCLRHGGPPPLCIRVRGTLVGGSDIRGVYQPVIQADGGGRRSERIGR